MVDESKEKDTTHIRIMQETKADLEAIGNLRNISGYNNIIQQLIAWRYERDFTLEEAVTNNKGSSKYKKIKKPHTAVIDTEIILCWREYHPTSSWGVRTRTEIQSKVKEELRSRGWEILYPEFFKLKGRREGITRYIDDRLKALIGQNVITKQNPEKNDGLYELDVASISEKEWMLLVGFSCLAPQENLQIKILDSRPKKTFN